MSGSRRAQRGLCKAMECSIESWDKNCRVTKSARVMKKGKLSAAELVRTRVRHFSEGLVLGSRAWVEEAFKSHRENFGPKRKTGARKLESSEGELYAMRRLRPLPK